MLEIGNTIVSEVIFEKKFICDLERCKGACCVKGDAGAPLESSEVEYLEMNLDRIKPYLRPEGIKAIEKEGVFVTDAEGDVVTSLVNGAECSFAVFSERGIAMCGIEKAYEAGAIEFRKPVSCHLYPIRISKVGKMDAVNYSAWDICNPACKLGKEMGVKVYRFLRDAIVRKFGEGYYNDLEEVDKALDKAKK